MLKIKRPWLNEKKRSRAVRDHLAGATLKQVAQRYQVHLVTVARWVKRYRLGGIKNLRDDRRGGSWNRLPVHLEEQIWKIKERCPGITVRQARAWFIQRGHPVSASAIYAVWKRHNLITRSVFQPTSPYGRETSNIRQCLAEAAVLIRRGRWSGIKRAAGMINDLPYYPEGRSALLQKLPERLLSTRRRFDQLYGQYLRLPMPVFYRRIHILRKQLEREHLNYSALLAGIVELQALHWMRHPRAEIALYRRLDQRRGKLRDPVINFLLTLQLTMALFELGRTREAQVYNRKTRQLLKKLPYASFYESYGDILTFMGDYQSSLHYYNCALAKKPDQASRISLMKKIALNLVISGHYLEASKYLTRLNLKPGQQYYEEYLSCRAFLYYGLGHFEEALHYVRETLDRAQRHQFRNTIYSAVIVRAAIARALGRENESRELLIKYIRLLDKYHMKREVTILDFLLRAAEPSPGLRKMPVLHLLFLMVQIVRSERISAYRQAYAYARKKGLLGFFHRAIVFSPEIIKRMLDQGRRTDLPRAILKFPVFNLEVPSYTVKFLGRLVVNRGAEYLKVHFAPKEAALLVHIALRAGEPYRFIPVQDLYQNFWPRSRNAASRLSHLLVKLKQKISMPGHLVSMASRAGMKCLVNRGFYMSTDYQDFETTLTEAQALERTGEWRFARDKYRQAFRLMRGEPFARSYDAWSEDLRHRILTRYEQEVQRFIRTCGSHHCPADARQAAEQLRRIIRPTDDINHITDDRQSS